MSNDSIGLPLAGFLRDLPRQVGYTLVGFAVLGLVAWLGWPPWAAEKVDVGEAFELGAFRYTVEHDLCKAETVGGERTGEDVCVFSVGLANTSDRSEEATDHWELVTANGETYSPPPTGGWSDGDVFPGNAQVIKLFFDVPPGTQPEKVVVSNDLLFPLRRVVEVHL